MTWIKTISFGCELVLFTLNSRYADNDVAANQRSVSNRRLICSPARSSRSPALVFVVRRRDVPPFLALAFVIKAKQYLKQKVKWRRRCGATVWRLQPQPDTWRCTQLNMRKSQLTACLSALQPFRAARPQKQLALGIISLVWVPLCRKGDSWGCLPYLTPPHPKEPNTPNVCWEGVGWQLQESRYHGSASPTPHPSLCAHLPWLFLCFGAEACGLNSYGVHPLLVSVETWQLQKREGFQSCRCLQWGVNIAVWFFKPATRLIPGAPGGNWAQMTVFLAGFVPLPHMDKHAAFASSFDCSSETNMCMSVYIYTSLAGFIFSYSL